MFDFTREELIDMLPIVAATAVAVIGWVVTYFHSWYFDRKASKLDRVNRQLRELYGPLYARLMAADSAWEAFWSKHRPAHGANSYFGAQVSEEEKATWRTWMTNVFEPNNAQMEELIVQNLDLLETDRIPKAFVDALAHIAAYKAILAEWRNSDFTNHVSVNNWPGLELMKVVKPEYEKLRARQKKLLGS